MPAVIHVKINCFFCQVQRKRNPLLKKQELVVVCRGEVLSATTDAERLGYVEGRSASRVTLSDIGKRKISLIHHPAVCRAQFRPYWIASRNIHTTLRSIVNSVERLTLDEFLLSFDDSQLHLVDPTACRGVVNTDRVLDHVLNLLTELGYESTVSCRDDASLTPKSVERSESVSVTRIEGYLNKSGCVDSVCVLRLVHPAIGDEQSPQESSYLASSVVHEYTLTFSHPEEGYYRYDDIIVAGNGSPAFQELVRTWWDICELDVRSTCDTIEKNSNLQYRYSVTEMIIELDGLPMMPKNALAGSRGDQLQFTFRSEMQIVEIEQAMELISVVMEKIANLYTSNELRAVARMVTLRSRLKRLNADACSSEYLWHADILVEHQNNGHDIVASFSVSDIGTVSAASLAAPLNACNGEVAIYTNHDNKIVVVKNGGDQVVSVTEPKLESLCGITKELKNSRTDADIGICNSATSSATGCITYDKSQILQAHGNGRSDSPSCLKNHNMQESSFSDQGPQRTSNRATKQTKRHACYDDAPYLETGKTISSCEHWGEFCKRPCLGTGAPQRYDEGNSGAFHHTATCSDGKITRLSPSSRLFSQQLLYIMYNPPDVYPS